MEDKGARLSLHSIRSLFGDTWRMYKERFAVLFEILLLPVLVLVLGYILLGLGSAFALLGILVVFIGFIAFVFSILPLIFSIHNTAGVDASYRATIGLFWPLVWLVILEMLAVMGGFVMLIVPGIWLCFSLSLMSYVFVIERRRGIDALRQSKDYIKGYWWAFFWRTLLLLGVYYVILLVIQLPILLVLGRIAGSIVSMALTLLITPFSAIYNYTIYNNLRELKPELAEVRTKEGSGFIKASAIVGIVAPVLIFLLVIIAAGFGFFEVFNHGSYNVNYHAGGYHDTQNGY